MMNETKKTTMRYEPTSLEVLTNALIAKRMAQGNDTSTANSYTLGYLQSLFQSVIDTLPKAKRKALEQEILFRINQNLV
jgi:hypothetical protein